MKSKREREEPCFVCNHYHDYEGGEPCSVCGHVLNSTPLPSPGRPTKEPTLILQDFLYLGSYDAASRCELLKAYGVTHVLNLVPNLPPLFQNTFTYHTVTTTPASLRECFQFLDACHAGDRRVLVYCMAGRSRSPTVVIAYLMKIRGWRLAESYRWVKDRRESVRLTDADFRRLQDVEVELHGKCSVECKESLEEQCGGGPFNLPSDLGAIQLPIAHNPFERGGEPRAASFGPPSGWGLPAQLGGGGTAAGRSEGQPFIFGGQGPSHGMEEQAMES